MKVRYGFVTNSSSSSFVIRKRRRNHLLEEILKHYTEFIGIIDPNKDYGIDTEDSRWTITEETNRYGDYIKCQTYMDNFNLYEFALDLGLDPIVRSGDYED